MTTRALALMAALALPAAAVAQHAAPNLSAVPPREATQFDFLVGEWSLVVHPPVSTLVAKLHGIANLSGTWKAWRAFDGWGIEDELRIVDASGNPHAFVHAMRVYDVPARHWTASTLDVYASRFGSSMAEWKDGEMTVTSHGMTADGKPTVARTRFYDITPAAFEYQQEQSTDGGRTWTTTLRMEAKRVAATAPR
jgi:hypothetical protein